MSRSAVLLGSRTIPGRPEHVADARAFVTGLLSGRRGCDGVAALLTSELVTNAVLHTRSGRGGAVTITVTDAPDGLLIEVTDDGSPGRAPAVSRDLAAAHGRGLLLVQELASQWGYRRDGARTTVWVRIGGGNDGNGARGPHRGAQAAAAAITPAQILARSSLPVMYGGMV